MSSHNTPIEPSQARINPTTTPLVTPIHIRSSQPQPSQSNTNTNTTTTQQSLAQYMTPRSTSSISLTSHSNTRPPSTNTILITQPIYLSIPEYEQEKINKSRVPRSTKRKNQDERLIDSVDHEQKEVLSQVGSLSAVRSKRTRVSIEEKKLAELMKRKIKGCPEDNDPKNEWYWPYVKVTDDKDKEDQAMLSRWRRIITTAEMHQALWHNPKDIAAWPSSEIEVAIEHSNDITLEPNEWEYIIVKHQLLSPRLTHILTHYINNHPITSSLVDQSHQLMSQFIRHTKIDIQYPITSNQDCTIMYIATRVIMYQGLLIEYLVIFIHYPTKQLHGIYCYFSSWWLKYFGEYFNKPTRRAINQAFVFCRMILRLHNAPVWSAPPIMVFKVMYNGQVWLTRASTKWTIISSIYANSNYEELSRDSICGLCGCVGYAGMRRTKNYVSNCEPRVSCTDCVQTYHLRHVELSNRDKYYGKKRAEWNRVYCVDCLEVKIKEASGDKPKSSTDKQHVQLQSRVGRQTYCSITAVSYKNYEDRAELDKIELEEKEYRALLPISHTNIKGQHLTAKPKLIPTNEIVSIVQGSREHVAQITSSSVLVYGSQQPTPFQPLPTQPDDLDLPTIHKYNQPTRAHSLHYIMDLMKKNRNIMPRTASNNKNNNNNNIDNTKDEDEKSDGSNDSMLEHKYDDDPYTFTPKPTPTITPKLITPSSDPYAFPSTTVSSSSKPTTPPHRTPPVPVPIPQTLTDNRPSAIANDPQIDTSATESESPTFQYLVHAASQAPPLQLVEPTPQIITIDSPHSSAQSQPTPSPPEAQQQLIVTEPLQPPIANAPTPQNALDHATGQKQTMPTTQQSTDEDIAINIPSSQDRLEWTQQPFVPPTSQTPVRPVVHVARIPSIPTRTSSLPASTTAQSTSVEALVPPTSATNIQAIHPPPTHRGNNQLTSLVPSPTSPLQLMLEDEPVNATEPIPIVEQQQYEQKQYEEKYEIERDSNDNEYGYVNMNLRMRIPHVILDELERLGNNDANVIKTCNYASKNIIAGITRMSSSLMQNQQGLIEAMEQTHQNLEQESEQEASSVVSKHQLEVPAERQQNEIALVHDEGESSNNPINELADDYDNEHDTDYNDLNNHNSDPYDNEHELGQLASNIPFNNNGQHVSDSNGSDPLIEHGCSTSEHDSSPEYGGAF